MEYRKNGLIVAVLGSLFLVPMAAMANQPQPNFLRLHSAYAVRVTTASCAYESPMSGYIAEYDEHSFHVGNVDSEGVHEGKVPVSCTSSKKVNLALVLLSRVGPMPEFLGELTTYRFAPADRDELEALLALHPRAGRNPRTDRMVKIYIVLFDSDKNIIGAMSIDGDGVITFRDIPYKWESNEVLLVIEES